MLSLALAINPRDPFWQFFLQTAVPFWIGFIILIIVLPPLFIWFWKKKVPRPARTLFWCAIRGYAPLLLVHDSGRADIIGIKERKAEGIVETTAGTFKILPRFAPVLSDEELQQIEDPEMRKRMQMIKNMASQKVKIGNMEFWLDYEHWMAKRTWLLGMPTPLFVGYTGKLCLLNPEALALYEAAELKIETADGTMFNPKHKKDANEEEAMQPLILLDPRKIGKFITSHFDQSQIAGVIQAAEERAKLGMRINLKRIAVFLIIFLIVIAVIFAAMYLPKMMGGMIPR